MRRTIILLAALGALLLVPAAAQAATGVEPVEVMLKGTGAGKAYIQVGPCCYRGTPEIECEYKSPGPQTGTCETIMSNEGEGWEQVYIAFEAAPGSKLVSVIDENVEDEGCGVQPGTEEKKGACSPYVEPAGTEPGEFGSGEAKVIATFEAEAVTLPLKVTHEGTGGGTIQSSPAGITCVSGECEHNFPENETVTLTASPAAGSAFVAWKNCDIGGVHGRQCVVHVTPGHKVVGAKFEPANTVTVKNKGTGQGSISGVTCGTNCTEASGIFLASKAVTLKAKANTKTSEFKGWTASPASCTLSEEGKTCSLGLLSANETVEAEFAEMARENLTVTKSGNGQGAVKSAPAGISCSYTCPTNTAYFYKGTSVTLTASIQEGKGSTLGNWGGACSGTAATPCVVTMSEAKEVTVGFN